MRRFNLVLAIGALALLAGAGPARPVARILQVTGSVTVCDAQQRTRPAVAFGSVYSGEQIRLAPDALVVLAFRHDGHMERLKTAGEVTVGDKGCAPASAVEVVAVAERHRDLVSRGIRELPAVTQGAVAMAHTGYSKRVGPWLRPVDGSTILTSAPQLSWPAVPHAAAYEITFRADKGPIRFFKTDQTQADLVFAPPLEGGATYRWTVTASVKGKPVVAYEASFAVATEPQKKEAAALVDLAAGSEIPAVALAALRLEQGGFVAEAFEAYQRLVKLAPECQAYRGALERLADRAIPVPKTSGEPEGDRSAPPAPKEGG